jgi:hypothetical protein
MRGEEIRLLLSIHRSSKQKFSFVTTSIFICEKEANSPKALRREQNLPSGWR